MEQIDMKHPLRLLEIDTYIYQWLERKHLGNRKYNKHALQSLVWIAQYSPIAMITMLVLVGLTKWGLQNEGKMIWLVPTSIVAGGISRVLSGVLGYLVPRTRPFAMFQSQPLIDHAPDYSFPSNHAAGGFALAVSVSYFSPAFGAAFLLWAMFLAISRIFVRLHYFSDVVTGALVGIVSAKISFVLFGIFIHNPYS